MHRSTGMASNAIHSVIAPGALPGRPPLPRRRTGKDCYALDRGAQRPPAQARDMCPIRKTWAHAPPPAGSRGGWRPPRACWTRLTAKTRARRSGHGPRGATYGRAAPIARVGRAGRSAARHGSLWHGSCLLRMVGRPPHARSASATAVRRQRGSHPPGQHGMCAHGEVGRATHEGWEGELRAGMPQV
jgi:hypothetical protein